MAVAPIPADLIQRLQCPLSYEVMENPVTGNADCRHTFERIWIEQWLNEHQTCPMCRKALTIANLQPNAIIRRACQIANRGESVNEADMTFLREAVATLDVHPLTREELRPIHERILVTLKAAGQVAGATTRAATDYMYNFF